MEEVDIIVIGAGPSGAVASAYLNKMKYKVLIKTLAKVVRIRESVIGLL